MFLFCDRFLPILFLWNTVQDSHAVSSSWPSSSTWFGDQATGLGFGSITDKFWNKEYLSSKINVRLVKKSWKPKGSKEDAYIQEFPGKVEEAFQILKTNTNYEYVSRPLDKAVELFTAKGDNSQLEFDRNLDSIIIAHPFYSNGDENFFTVPTVTALGMRNVHKKYNLFVIDMPELNINMFFTIVRELTGYETKYEPMAEVLCSFIVDGIQQSYWEPKKINFIGYSYSGNLVGYMARHIEFIFTKKVSSIMCLDPYSAQYNQHLIHIGKDDAEVVHILHTSSYVSGTRERIGTADFVFNDGYMQPECTGAKNIMNKILSFHSFPERMFLAFTCSHLKVVPRFWYVILYPSLFTARQCDTWQRFWNCLCENNHDAFISYPIVRRHIPFEGTYYLRTTSTKPYGLGDEGSQCNPEEKEKLKKKREEIGTEDKIIQ